MAILEKHKNKSQRGLINVLYLVVLLVLTVAVNSRSSRAEFAVPAVNPTDDISGANMRGVWAYNDIILGYEAWAVGVLPDPAAPDYAAALTACQAAYKAGTHPNGQKTTWDPVAQEYTNDTCNIVSGMCVKNSSLPCTGNADCIVLDAKISSTPPKHPDGSDIDLKDCNGVLYYYNAGQWKRRTPFLTTAPTFSINAIAGQVDQSLGLNKLWIVGAHGGIGSVQGFGPTSKFIKEEIEFAGSRVYNPGSPPYSDYNPSTPPVDAYAKDFYAVGAGQEWGLNVIAGGEKGLVAISSGGSFAAKGCRGQIHGDFGGIGCTTYGMTDVNCKGSDGVQYGECKKNYTWLQRDIVVSNDGNRSLFNGGKWENITGIQFPTKYVAYVLTTTFNGNKGLYDTEGRECTDSANQSYRLYKIPTNPNDFNKWTLLHEWSGGCAYGFSYSLRENNADDGPMVNDFWIATNNGVVKYIEQGNTWSLVGPSPKPIYSVTAINVRGGVGQNLLYNGNLNNWLGKLTFPDTNPQSLPNNVDVLPDGWLQYDESRHRWDLYGYHNQETYNNPVPPKCRRNNLNIRTSQDVATVSSTNHRSMVMEPALAYNTSSCTPGDTYRANVESAMIRVPVANTIQGQRFKVKAKVKVEFKYEKIEDFPSGEEPTLMPYGGIFTTCDGDRWDDTKEVANCSLTNRTHLRTLGHPTVDSLGQPVFEDVEFIVSRQNTQYADSKTQLMQVRCTASYGAKVTCDEISVEEITDPPLPAYDRVEVIAVGKDYTSISSADALATSPVFTNEKLPDISPTLGLDLNSTFALNSQHVYSVGLYRMLYNRTPSTLKGTVWLGTGHDNKFLGYASASCVNNRGNITYYDGSVVGTGITLCQRSPESYGLILDSVNDVMTGRAWFGKNIAAANGPNDDMETVDLGKCVNPPDNIGTTNDPRMQPSTDPYYLGNFCGNTKPLPIFPDICKPQEPGVCAVDQVTTCMDDTPCTGTDDFCELPTRFCKINSVQSCESDPDCNLPSARQKCWGYKGLYYDYTPTLAGYTQCSMSAKCANDKYGLCDTRVHLCWASNERDYDSQSKYTPAPFDPYTPIQSCTPLTGKCSVDTTTSCKYSWNCPTRTPAQTCIVLSGKCSYDGRACLKAEDCSTARMTFAQAKAEGRYQLDRSCFSDKDCFGRCAKDESFVCTSDDDCKITSKSIRPPTTVSTAPLSNLPYTMVTCTKNTTSACSSFGWLSFNKADFPSSLLTTPKGGTLGVSYNSTTGGLDGWARFMTPANDSTGTVTCTSGTCSNDSTVSCTSDSECKTGWVRFRGDPVPPVAAEPSGEFFGCHECTLTSATSGTCRHCQDDQEHSCQPSTTNTIAQCHYTCGGLTGTGAVPCMNSDDCTAAQATLPLTPALCKPPGRCSNDPALNCTSDTTCSSVNAGHCVFGAECETIGGQCQAYGVDFDKTTSKFHGYAWSQDFGWMDFSGVSKGGDRYLQTRLGDIYATGTIGKTDAVIPGGADYCNATFLIRSAADIINFCSAIEGTTGITAKNPNSTVIPFPGEQNVYENILGRFDVEGMKKDVSGGVGPAKNKYGQKIETLPVGDISTNWKGAMEKPTALRRVLGGKVYKVNGDAVVNSALSFDNIAVGETLADYGSGAGVLIVEGNLNINSSMAYGTTQVDDVRKLASLVIIVTGDVTVSPDVTNIAGNFYVIGSKSGTTGLFSTGESLTNFLTIRGVVISKAFHFQRTFAGTIDDPRPSELIINDGRIQSNPPPGMIDFVKALPSSVSLSP